MNILELHEMLGIISDPQFIMIYDGHVFYNAGQGEWLSIYSENFVHDLLCKYYSSPAINIARDSESAFRPVHSSQVIGFVESMIIQSYLQGWRWDGLLKEG